jgi:predicted nuclease of restriction endonuclease-like RecB superfamily
VLPVEMLITKTFRGQIRPTYVHDSVKLIELAESLIGVYQRGIGKKRSQIYSEVKEFEYGSFNFRLIRGLATILDRRSTFLVESPVDPYQLRKAVFSISEGFAITAEEKQRIIGIVSKEFKIHPEDVEKYLWSDLEDEQVMRGFRPVSAMDLLAAYNLSLTQTLLFRSTVLEFRVRENWKRIFRGIKRLGLMYAINRDQAGYTVSLEGPISIIKLTERYGTNVARLLPEIVMGGEWSVRAQIVSRWRDNKRLLTFELGSSEGVLLPTRVIEPEELYDSSLEEDFAKRFNSLGTRWKLLREPEPIPVGATIMIPDFAFVLGDKRIYLEIVGFWTPDYITKKINKLQMIRDVDMLIAVDESLGISKKIPGNVITFEKEVPLKPILDKLEIVEKNHLEVEMEQAAQLQIRIEGECVELDELAASSGVSKEALRKTLVERPVDSFVLIGDYLISREKLGALEKLIAGERLLSTLTPKLEAEGLKDPYPLLNYFGYQVKWHGLNWDSAEIVKQENMRK